MQRNMKRRFVQSSAIKTVGYDAEKHILEIGFHNENAVWRYYDLPEEVYAAFVKAESKGNFFVTKIKGKYTEKRVR